jgi:hypothetical protein
MWNELFTIESDPHPPVPLLLLFGGNRARTGREGEESFPRSDGRHPHFHPPNPSLGVFGPWITVPHGPQATSRGSGLIGACATSSFAEGKTSAGCHLRPRRRCPFLLRLDGPVSCLRFSPKRSIGYCDTFFVKHSSPVEAVPVSWCAKLTIDSASWKKMVQDALNAVAVVTFDYPCQLIHYFSLLLC